MSDTMSIDLPQFAGDILEGSPVPAAFAEREPLLPDGIGLSVDDVRQLLFKMHDANIPKDDPTLMVVTILNAFLEEQVKLQERHRTALAKFMGEQTAAYVAGVEKTTEELKQTLSGVAIEGIQKAASGFSESLGSFRGVLFLCTSIMALSALLNVAVYILGKS